MRKDESTQGDGEAEIDLGVKKKKRGIVSISGEGTEQTDLLRQHGEGKLKRGEAGVAVGREGERGNGCEEGYTRGGRRRRWC